MRHTDPGMQGEVNVAAAARFSHIGTTHDCSERRDTSKNVLVPKSAKQMVLEQALWGRSRGGLCTLAPLETEVQAERGEGSEVLADLSLLCLWPFGNSLTETVHSEFYQCHTQDRSHTLRPADPAEGSAALSWRSYNLLPPPHLPLSPTV